MDIGRWKFFEMPKMCILKAFWPHTTKSKQYFFGNLYDRLKAYWIFVAATFASSATAASAAAAAAVAAAAAASLEAKVAAKKIQ